MIKPDQYVKAPEVGERGGRNKLRMILALTAASLAASIGALYYSEEVTSDHVTKQLANLLNTQYEPYVFKGDYGVWKSWYYDSTGNTAVCGAQVRLEKSCGSKCDDTSANGLRYLFCNKDNWHDNEWKTIYTGNWGRWSSKRTGQCPVGKYVSDVKVRYEDHKQDNDDTSLNGLQIYCRSPDWSGGQTITVENGNWGTWKSWSDRSIVGYFVTGARVRYEDTKRNIDDTTMNGIQNEIRPIKFKKNNVNISQHGYWYLQATGKQVQQQLKTTIEKTTGSQNSKALSKEYSDRMTAGASVTVKASYGVVSGSATANFEYEQNSKVGQQISSLTSSSLRQTKEITTQANCPQMGNKMAKLYVYQMHLKSEGLGNLNISSVRFACCYGAQEPKCPVPSACVDWACQKCAFK